MTEFSPTSLSLFGPDGCGKSAIARTIQAKLCGEQEVLLIGASDYKKWLTDPIAKRFTKAPLDGLSGTALYESISIACYGYVQELTESGKSVIVDSDPYLKRMVWAKIEKSETEYEDYVGGFEERVTQALGEVCGPANLAIIELADSTNKPMSAEELGTITHDRIHARSVVSGFDPTSVEENMRIHEASNHVLEHVIIPRLFSRIPERPFFIANGQCPPDAIDAHLDRVSGIVIDYLAA